MSGPALVFLLLLSAACFGIGFGVALMRARRRLRAKLEARLREEASKKMAEEVLRRLREGELEQRIDAALREELDASGSTDAQKRS